MRSVLLIVLFLPLVATAQTFKAESHLPKVETDGFYRVELKSEIDSYLSDGASNLRIFDQNQKEVPYFLQKQQATYSQNRFKEYPVLEKKSQKGCCTSLILSNAEGRSINNISLLIRNAEVSKHATLMGSDDQKEWFALKEHFVFHSINNVEGIAEVSVIDFPLNNYRYLSLIIEDSASAPLNILKAGYYDEFKSSGSYAKIPVNVLSRDSSSIKRTYYHLIFDAAHFIDKVEFSFGGEPFFRRRATMRIKKDHVVKGETKAFYQFVTSFDVSSSNPTALLLSSVKTNEILIEVENDDNPTLTLNWANAYTLNRYVVAWLKKDYEYVLKLGDANMHQPSYDLTFFKDSIPADSPVLQLADVIPINDVRTEPSATIFTSRNYIWGAILAVIALLGFFSVRMIKDVNSSKKE